MAKLSTLFRQFSLVDCDLPAFPSSTAVSKNTRPILRKQVSLDLNRDEAAVKKVVKVAWHDTTCGGSGPIVKKFIPQQQQHRQSSLDRESILSSKVHQCPPRESEGKQRKNLNIFLAHNIDNDETSRGSAKEVTIPKLIPPLLDLVQSPRPMFQIRKTPPRGEASDRDGGDNKGIKNVIIRPSTALQDKRNRFKQDYKKSSAFNSFATSEGPPGKPTNRPPLLRASSAPPTKKFPATKRKLKSTTFYSKISRCNDPADLSGEDAAKNPTKLKELNRQVMVIGSDIVTMVSLISPGESEDEDKTVGEEVNGKKDSLTGVEHKKKELNVSLRKTVKSVSFQQSSIHAVRSFSASFPARRASSSMMMVPTAQAKVSPSNTCAVEKPKEAIKHEAQNDGENLVVDPKGTKGENDAMISVQENSNVDNGYRDKKNEFGSDKEKQCWVMYCKMTERGLKVSYNTLLRGMLTPTEYRMVKKEIVVEENTLVTE